MEMQKFHNVTTPADIADALGEVKARQKELKDIQIGLERYLKAQGLTEADGTKYRVTVSYGIITARVDYRAIVDKLGTSRQMLAAHTKRNVSDRVSVKALVS